MRLGTLEYTFNNPSSFLQNVSWPATSSRIVSFEGATRYLTCSSAFPTFGGMVQTVTMGNTTDFRTDLPEGVQSGLRVLEHPLGNPAVSTIYPQCYASVEFKPFFYTEDTTVYQSLQLGTTQGDYSFDIAVSMSGYLQGSAALLGAPLVTREATVPVTLSITNENCAGEPMASLMICPVFTSPTLSWKTGGCPKSNVSAFLDAGLHFVSTPLVFPPPAGEAAPDTLLAAMTLTCAEGGCPAPNTTYLTRGALPLTNPLRNITQWLFGGCFGSFCGATCYYKLKDTYVYIDLLANHSGTFNRSYTDYFDVNWPIILTSRLGLLPAEVYEGCLKDLAVYHNGTGTADVPLEGIKLNLTAVRNDMIRMTPCSATLTLAVPARAVCSGDASDPADSVSATVARVVVPAVVVPTVVVGAAIAAALFVARRSRGQIRSNAADLHTSSLAL
jgi:hypothetical protein